MDYNGSATLRRVLLPGEGYIEHTYASHCWILRDVQTDQYMMIIIGNEASYASQRYSLAWNPSFGGMKASIMARDMGDDVEPNLNRNSTKASQKNSNRLLSSGRSILGHSGFRTTVFEKRETRKGEGDAVIRNESRFDAKDDFRDAATKLTVTIVPQ